MTARRYTALRTVRVLLSKFCEYATQQRNGRHSMIGVFDNIVAPAFPLDHPPFFLCLQTEFEPTEAGQAMNVQAILIDADGKQVMDVTASGTVPGDSRGGATRIFIQFLLPLVFHVLGDKENGPVGKQSGLGIQITQCNHFPTPITSFFFQFPAGGIHGGSIFRVDDSTGDFHTDGLGSVTVLAGHHQLTVPGQWYDLGPIRKVVHMKFHFIPGTGRQDGILINPDDSKIKQGLRRQQGPRLYYRDFLCSGWGLNAGVRKDGQHRDSQVKTPEYFD